MNREEWLEQAAEFICCEYLAKETPKLSISMGFPSSGSRGGAIVTARPKQESQDGETHQIFVKPTCTNSTQILDQLVGVLASIVGEVLKDVKTDEYIESVIDILGEIPHTALVSQPKKQTTRMHKLECECGAIWRMSAKWAEQVKQCPCCTHGIY